MQRKARRACSEKRDPIPGRYEESNEIETDKRFAEERWGIRPIRYPMDPETGERVTVEYDYVAAGVKSIKLKQGLQYKMIVEAITYNEHGQMETISRGNGTTTNYYYDEKSRLLQLTTTDKSNDKIQNSTYGYYPDNTIAWKQDETGTGAAYRKTRYDYEYDGLDRIAKANGAYSFGENQNARTFTQDYEYTLTGNITTKRTQESATKPLGETYSYAYNNHAVTTIDSIVTPNRFEFRYDASGNMTYSRDGTKARNIAFDSNNRITKVTDDKTGEVQGEYTYDEQGFRIRKTAKEMTGTDDPSVRVDLIYPSMYFALERKVTSKGQEIPDTAYAINNIYLNGVRIAATKANGEAKYYLTDQVDSVSLVADDDARVETRTEYMPFGETWFQEGDSVNKPKYNSQELDAETGLYFYNARYYDGEIGRFVTADQVIDGEYDTQGWNRYAYVKNSPINSKDPTGNAKVGANDWISGNGQEWGKGGGYYGYQDNKNDIAAANGKRNNELMRAARDPGPNEKINISLKVKLERAEITKERREYSQQVRGRVFQSIYDEGYGVMVSDWGARIDPINGAFKRHQGTDYWVNDGMLRASIEGQVTVIPDNGGLGHTVVIKGPSLGYDKHDKEMFLENVQGHIDECIEGNDTVPQFFVKTGDYVYRGDIIAKQGSTGRSTGPHVHEEFRISGKTYDPSLLPKEFEGRRSIFSDGVFKP